MWKENMKKAQCELSVIPKEKSNKSLILHLSSLPYSNMYISLDHYRLNNWYYWYLIPWVKCSPHEIHPVFTNRDHELFGNEYLVSNRTQNRQSAPSSWSHLVPCNFNSSSSWRLVLQFSQYVIDKEAWLLGGIKNECTYFSYRDCTVKNEKSKE